MAEVFISYKRNIDPDSSLAVRVFEALQANGNGVFIDRTLTVGQPWAKEIEAKVRGSDFLVVFLTAASSASEMVKGEVEIARDQAAKSGKGPRILPVRLAYTGPLPYPLNAYLDSLQYALWRGQADTDRLIRELTDAVTGSDLPTGPITSSTVSQRETQPLHSAPLPPPGGGLDIDDPRYIRRSTDERVLGTISQQGVTLIIKGSRQMGKTSLLVRSLSAAMESGKRCALIDFQMLGQESLSDRAKFFRRFGQAVTEALDLPSDPTPWESNLSDSQNLSRYMERQVLQDTQVSTVLAIDEADLLFQAESIYGDFFGMLRSWHNQRANPIKKKLWKRLDLILVTSTEPYLFIDRDHESPFNVGEIIPLSDFDISQVRRLNELHDSPLFSSESDRLYDLLQGQPYLTRKALYLFKNGMTPNQLFAGAAEDSGPFGDHLRNYFLRLLNYPNVAAALKQVARGQGCSDRKLAYRLEGAGLVKSVGGKVVPRCTLYAQYFRDRL